MNKSAKIKRIILMLTSCPPLQVTFQKYHIPEFCVGLLFRPGAERTGKINDCNVAPVGFAPVLMYAH